MHALCVIGVSMDVCVCVEQTIENVKTVCAALQFQCNGVLVIYSVHFMLVSCLRVFVLGSEVSHAI